MLFCRGVVESVDLSVGPAARHAEGEVERPAQDGPDRQSAHDVERVVGTEVDAAMDPKAGGSNGGVH